PTPQPRVVFAATQLAGAEVLARGLQEQGCDVDLVDGPSEALAEVRRGSPDVVVLSTVGPGPSGFEGCFELRRDVERVPVVLVSPFDADPRDRAGGRHVGATDVIPLMRPLPELVDEVMAAIERTPPPPVLGSSATAEAAAHVQRHRG